MLQEPWTLKGAIANSSDNPIFSLLSESACKKLLSQERTKSGGDFGIETSDSDKKVLAAQRKYDVKFRCVFLLWPHCLRHRSSPGPACEHPRRPRWLGCHRLEAVAQHGVAVAFLRPHGHDPCTEACVYPGRHDRPGRIDVRSEGRDTCLGLHLPERRCVCSEASLANAKHDVPRILFERGRKALRRPCSFAEAVSLMVMGDTALKNRSILATVNINTERNVATTKIIRQQRTKSGEDFGIETSDNDKKV